MRAKITGKPCHGLLFNRVIHGESTKGFTYTFGQKTSPGMGMGTDDPWDPDPYPSGPGIRTSPGDLARKARKSIRKCSELPADRQIKPLLLFKYRLLFFFWLLFILLDALLTL